VFIELTSSTSGRTVRLKSKALCKVLHLVNFHGWHPERLDSPPPSSSWDTQLIVSHLQPYLSCQVTDSDAANLAESLDRMLDSEAIGLQADIHFAALVLKTLAGDGAFNITPQPE